MGRLEGKAAIITGAGGGIGGASALAFARRRFNHIHGFPIVGSPDAVARTLADVSAAGFNGLAIGMINYLDELPFFCAEVLPRLERLGVREPLRREAIA